MTDITMKLRRTIRKLGALQREPAHLKFHPELRTLVLDLVRQVHELTMSTQTPARLGKLMQGLARVFFDLVIDAQLLGSGSPDEWENWTTEFARSLDALDSKVASLLVVLSARWSRSNA